MKLRLMGIAINTETKQELLAALALRIQDNKPSFIVTPYSEFFYYAAKDANFQMVINNADFAIPDGISVLWLSYYLICQPITVKNYYLKICQAFWQMVYSLALILLAPKKIHQIIPEKISGSDFFWDLAAFAVEKKLSIFLLGGFGDTPAIVSKRLQQKFPALKIAGISNALPDDLQLLDKINNSQADVLFVAFGPKKQESWIYKNMSKLHIKIAIGIGGTFDYVAGKRSAPPQAVRQIGLEWLYRLITQPTRFMRIWHATFDFLQGAIREKVFMTLPFRNNVAGVIINNAGKILLVKRRLSEKDLHKKTITLTTDWQIPQGGVEEGELPEAAVLREVAEETGIRNVSILGKAEQTFAYIWPHFIRKLFSSTKRYRYKGQAQTIFFLNFTGKDAEINLSLDPDTSDPEHLYAEYQWVRPEELRIKCAPMRQPQIDIILREIKNFQNA